MKKFLLIITLAFYTVISFAQTDKSNFHFGIKAQPALAWFNIDAPEGVDLKSDGLPFGFGYGLITDFGFAQRYAFSTGLEVVYRGGKTLRGLKNLLGQDSTIATKYTLQFVELPITLKLRTNEIGYMTYFFQVGFEPGVAIRTKADITTNNNGSSKTKTKVDVGDDINEFNLSMIIAAGAEYNISGNTSLLLGITFNNGFLDLLDDSQFNGQKVKGTSNFLALTAGIMF
ncbi:MAG: porin family protein [Bacteroidota bacterium]